MGSRKLKTPRKPRPLKSRMPWLLLARVDEAGNAGLAHVGWPLEDAERLYAWLGAFIRWKRHKALKAKESK